jgi:hypothetical protein
VVGKVISNITRITLYVSTMTFGGRSPSVKILELGMFVQIQIPISSWLRAIFGRLTFRHDLKAFLKTRISFQEIAIRAKKRSSRYLSSGAVSAAYRNDTRSWRSIGR